MARRTGLATQPDWRYIVSSTEMLGRIRTEIQQLYHSSVASAEGVVAAVVGLMRRLQGRLVFLQDMVSFVQCIFTLQTVN